MHACVWMCIRMHMQIETDKRKHMTCFILWTHWGWGGWGWLTHNTLEECTEHIKTPKNLPTCNSKPDLKQTYLRNTPESQRSWTWVRLPWSFGFVGFFCKFWNEVMALHSHHPDGATSGRVSFQEAGPSRTPQLLSLCIR